MPQPPPHVMWPSGDSGFEASPWSPAGVAEAQATVLAKLSRRHTRIVRRVVLPLAVAYIGWIAYTLVRIAL